MRSIPAKELSLENFDQYGSFSRLINPDKVSVGPAIHEFFCDQLVYYTASTSPVGISTSRVLKRPVVVDTTEIHRCCGEVILPLHEERDLIWTATFTSMSARVRTPTILPMRSLSSSAFRRVQPSTCVPAPGTLLPSPARRTASTSWSCCRSVHTPTTASSHIFRKTGRSDLPNEASK